MRFPPHRWIWTLTLTLIAACASGAMPRSGQGNDEITTDEIRASAAVNTYQLVQALHPEWLWKRGRQSLEEGQGEEVAVYYGNAHIGGPDALREIATAAITSVRFFDAPAAQYRWGPGHTHGAILVLAIPNH